MKNLKNMPRYFCASCTFVLLDSRNFNGATFFMTDEIQPIIPHIHFKMKFPGVYILYYEGNIQYVGSSLHDIGSRIYVHVKDKFFPIDSVSWVCQIEGRADFDIRKLENDIIEFCQPKYNVIGKSNGGRYRGRYKGKKVTRHEQTLDF